MAINTGHEVKWVLVRFDLQNFGHTSHSAKLNECLPCLCCEFDTCM